MKKIILLLLSSFLGFSQNYIELSLVNENIGTPYFISGSGIYGSGSNDAGLNAILQNHNVLTYADKGFNPADNIHYMGIECGNCNIQNLKQDLINYNSVIQSASSSLIHYFYFNNTLRVKFINSSFITSINPTSGIVVTNDTTLNTIFQNHSVYLMNNTYSTQDTYLIKCNDCNLNNLKAELNAYTSEITYSELVYCQLMLSNETFENNITSIYPNPFQNELNIETDKTITNYEVVDISGKTIINSNNKVQFDNSISQLSGGLYILQLNYEDGTNSSHKIVKN